MKYLSVICTICLFLISECYGQQSISKPKEPNFSPYYFHRVDHFETLPDTPDEIFFLGNSISDGCEWSELFADLRFKNRGISGDVTDGVLYRLHQIIRCKPQMVFLMIGINDLAHGHSCDYVVNNHLRIYDLLHKESPGTNIVVESILPVNDNFSIFKNHVSKTDSIVIINRRLKEICDQRNYPFVDLYKEMCDEKGKLKKELTNDGLHLNGLGYLVWKEKIKPLLP